MKAQSGSRGAGCRDRRALVRWIEKGGRFPSGLVSHIRGCSSCHAWAMRIVRVDGAITMLATETLPPGLLGRANDHALRMLARRLRESQEADRLRQARPQGALWPRMEQSLGRAGSAAAAALIVLALRAGVADGMEQAFDLAQPLADTHYQRHIDDSGMLS